jgi:hypothetical protein
MTRKKPDAKPGRPLVPIEENPDRYKLAAWRAFFADGFSSFNAVADMYNTSVTMLERTYSRFIADHSDALTRRALLDTAEPAAAGNVVPLGRRS